MTTYNTGNPVPSADARDRFDNSQTFDEVINGGLTYYTNRVGNNVLSLKGMAGQFDAAQLARDAEFLLSQSDRNDQFNTWLDASGFENPPLTYVDGTPLVVDRVTQLVVRSGALYTVRRPASFPYTITGNWAVDQTHLVLRNDIALRQELASAIGSTLSGHTRLSTLSAASNVAEVLSRMPIDPYEKADLILDRSGAPSTWDWTPAIDAVNAMGRPVHYGPQTFNYNGTGIGPTSNWVFRGAGMEKTIINLGPNSYFVDSTSVFNAITLTGITFNGGYGIVRSTGAGNLVGLTKNISSCSFKGYTRCAISHNANDNPYWKIRRCNFQGGNTTTTIGVALGRNSDCSDIDYNAFLNNKVHVKLRNSGRVGMKFNDFIQFSAGSQRAAVWLTSPNNLQVLVLTALDNKFGNENLGATDYRLLIQAEAAGTLNGDTLPDFAATECTGIYELDLQGGMVNGAGPQRPVIYSASHRLRNSVIDKVKLLGTAPSYLLEYADPAGMTDSYVSGVFFGHNPSEANAAVGPIPNTNRTSNSYSFDPSHSLEGLPNRPNSTQALSVTRTGYTQLLSTRAQNFTVVAGAAKIGNIPDSSRGGEAAEYNFTGLNGEVRSAIAVQPGLNQNCFIELELAKGTAGPATSVRIQLFAGSDVSFARGIVLPDEFGFFRFPFSLSKAATTLVRIVPDQIGSFKLGKIRIYQSRSPVPLAPAVFENFDFSRLPTSSAGLPQGFGYLSGGFVRYVE